MTCPGGEGLNNQAQSIPRATGSRDGLCLRRLKGGALVGYDHDQPLKIRAKSDRYGRWVVVRNAKTTGFPGGDGVFKKRGSGTEDRKMRILTRKARSLWF